MDANLQAFLYREGSKTVSAIIGLVSRPRQKPAAEESLKETSGEKPATPPPSPLPVASVAKVIQPQAPGVSLPTAEETTQELKRRLGRELYKAELDFSAGLLIAGKPCDCLDNKHRLGIEAEAEELIASDPRNPVYQEIIQWFKDNGHKLTIPAIVSGEYKPEYSLMANQFKEFRKRVLGTAAFDALAPASQEITLEDAKKIAANEAADKVEKL